MQKLKEAFKDKIWMRYSIFIVFTLILIGITYIIITNFFPLLDWGGGHIEKFLSAISPLLIGLVLAYLINPIVTLIDNKLMGKIIKLQDEPEKAAKQIKKRRMLSILLSYVVLLIAILGIIYFFTAMIIGEFIIDGASSVIHSAINYIVENEEKLMTWLEEIQVQYTGTKLDFAGTIIQWWNDNVNLTELIQYIVSLGGSVFNFVIGIIISIYLIADKEFFIKIIKQFMSLTLKDNKDERILGTLGEVNSVLKNFIKGVCIDAMIVAILSSTALKLLGLEFGVFVGIFAGMCNVIPYFGPVIGMIPAFFIGLFTDGFWTGAFAVIALLVVQQIDCNLIYPRVVGQSTGLRPLFVLLAVTVLGAYGGLVGMILAVPIAGILQIFILRFIKRLEIRSLARKNDSELKESSSKPIKEEV